MCGSVVDLFIRCGKIYNGFQRICGFAGWQFRRVDKSISNFAVKFLISGEKGVSSNSEGAGSYISIGIWSVHYYNGVDAKLGALWQLQ